MPLVSSLVSTFAGAGSIPLDEALGRAAEATGVGEAFLIGYHAALRSLVPTLAPGTRAALCATEDAGTHPRVMETRISSHRLVGKKTWVTGGTECDVLLVVASTGLTADGKNQLVVVQVDPKAPGVKLQTLPPPPFVPEVPHAEVTFEEVAVAQEQVLPGDGYTRYLKPFRTIEDIHVHGCVLAYVLATAERAKWPATDLEEGAALLVQTRALAQLPPSSPATHLALGGSLALLRTFLSRTQEEWTRVDPQVQQRWHRDAKLLNVAERVRSARTQKAWQTLGFP